MWFRSLCSCTGSSAAKAMLLRMMIIIMKVSKQGIVTMPWTNILILIKR